MKFGSFDDICRQVSLTVCPLLGSDGGLSPDCFARNIDIGGFIIFQSPTLLIHLTSLLMTAIMLYHIKSKYTAVGRKEIIMFFYMFIAITIFDFLLEGNFIQMSNAVYPYFTAIHVGLITATCWCLFLNGLIGFQFAEDGTPFTLWGIRITSAVMGAIGTVIALVTFLSKSKNPIALFIVYYLLNGVLLLVYVVLQVILVLNTLDDRWPLGDIAFGVLFFAFGQVMMLVLSQPICTGTNHYVDGLFFGHICTLLAVMMVYKYWDSITKEDLEFSVGGKLNVWEVKDEGSALLGDESVEDDFMVPVTAASGTMTPTTREKMFGEGGVGFEHGRYGV